MLKFMTGDMFAEPADVRVNTVNCVGVMGAGVALAFKNRYPDMFRDYQKACKAGEVKPGHLNVWKDLLGEEWIVNFPTKRHWREPSRYEDIESGLCAFREFLTHMGRVRVTLPALGCGHGGLEWDRVSKMIEDCLSDLEAEILIFSPQSSRDVGKNAYAINVQLKERLDSEGVSVIGPSADSYPQKLKGRSALELYVKGDSSSLNSKAVAIILSNKPEKKELKTAEECLDEFLKENITPVFSYNAAERSLIKRALEKKSPIILWIAEGILNFTVRKELRDVWNEGLVTIVSASRPEERWNPSAAYRAKYLEMKTSKAALISDPEPFWLSKLKRNKDDELPVVFFIKYNEVNEKNTQLINDFNGWSIGKNPQTLLPNIRPILSWLEKVEDVKN